MTTCFGQGNDYSSQCSGQTVGNTLTDAKSKGVVNLAVDIVTSGINMLLSGGMGFISDGPNGTMQKADLLKAVLAARCVGTSGLTDTWKMLQAAYLVMKVAGLGQTLTSLLNQYLPSVCACKYYVNSFASFIPNGSSSMAQLEGCSEGATTTTS